MSLNLAYSMREGMLGLKRARWATTITISTVAISMALLGVFLLITINVQAIAESFRDRVTLEAFLDDALEQRGCRPEVGIGVGGEHDTACGLAAIDQHQCGCR